MKFGRFARTTSFLVKHSSAMECEELTKRVGYRGGGEDGSVAERLRYGEESSVDRRFEEAEVTDHRQRPWRRGREVRVSLEFSDQESESENYEENCEN
ncbi:hypothetical protein Bca52824_091801 [Brassica carinata]|uniref:Uncharacterized protein n=1 Tax=Brassica carinata TaxID=52824 RepID=A0A8X7TER9_BRACI|nr:hypothetical protein Bca52824_091801 [Brassica carinata]